MLSSVGAQCLGAAVVEGFKTTAEVYQQTINCTVTAYVTVIALISVLTGTTLDTTAVVLHFLAVHFPTVVLFRSLFFWSSIFNQPHSVCVGIWLE